MSMKNPKIKAMSFFHGMILLVFAKTARCRALVTPYMGGSELYGHPLYFSKQNDSKTKYKFCQNRCIFQSKFTNTSLACTVEMRFINASLIDSTQNKNSCEILSSVPLMLPTIFQRFSDPLCAFIFIFVS